MLSIKDYLVLKRIFNYLDEEKAEKLRENNNFSNLPIDELTKMLEALGLIIYKLETEE